MLNIFSFLVFWLMVFLSAFQLQKALIKTASQNGADTRPLHSTSTYTVLMVPLAFFAGAPFLIIRYLNPGSQIAVWLHIAGPLLLSLLIWLARARLKEYVISFGMYCIAELISSVYTYFPERADAMPLLYGAMAIGAVIVVIRFFFSNREADGDEEDDSDPDSSDEEDDEDEESILNWIKLVVTPSRVATVVLFVVFLAACWFLLHQLRIV